tara:strand:- start:742 stop:1053 length:312 start_codon:yes stop_codon:yes gene_type:complete
MTAFDRAWELIKTPVVEMQVNFLLEHPNINVSMKSILQEAQFYYPNDIGEILDYVHMMSPADAQHMVELLTQQFTGDLPSNEPDYDPDYDDMMQTPKGLEGLE